MLTCGRAMTWVEMTSPTFSAPADAGVDGGLDRGDVAADDGGDVAAAGLLVRHQVDLGRLHHRVGGLDHRCETPAFDHAECFSHLWLPSLLV